MADTPPYPGTPRWVKVSVAIIGVVVLLFIILKVAGFGGGHGPHRHRPTSTQSP
jgi:hypothetical protein